jgi:hypothetical protein
VGLVCSLVTVVDDEAMMNNATTKVAMELVKGSLKVARLTFYVLLLLLGRVLLPIANFTIFVGVVVSLFCFFVRSDLSIPMWAGAGLAVGATALSAFYEAALRLVAPAGVVIVSEV